MRLIGAYSRDATAELSKIYRKLVPDAVLDEDVRSGGEGILHSNNHVYIYRFTVWERCDICYGNDGALWPIEDETLWPWTAAKRLTPWMNKDVWNLIFHRLAPYDILSLRQVCRQLRKYVQDPRAWQHFDGLSTNWRFYQNLLSCQKKKTFAIPHFLCLICVPHGYGNGKVVRGAKDDYYIGEITLERKFKKRNYTFSTSSRTVFYFREHQISFNHIVEELKMFLKQCRGDWKNYPRKYSPLVASYLFR